MHLCRDRCDAVLRYILPIKSILAVVLLSILFLPGLLHAQNSATLMPANASPAFEVSTIKPANPENESKNYSFEGRIFKAENYNVEDLLALGYGLHTRQVIGEPAWFGSALYDIEGIPDLPGRPNQQQKCLMIQKLLADRFGLRFHIEKRPLAVYAITVAKSGPRLTRSIADADAPERFHWVGRLGDLKVDNMTISEFAIWFQKNVTDKPVVDHTGLTGRYDFTLTWTPSEWQFPQFRKTGGFIPSPTDGLLDAKAPPDLYKAFDEQLGLHLEAARTLVDVMIIDHADKPLPN